MGAKAKTPVDVTVSNHGSIFLFEPQTEAGSEWCSEHLPEDAMMFGSAFVVEHRYARDIAQGMLNDGLVLA